MIILISDFIPKPCAECGKDVQVGKVWCDDCFNKRRVKWDKEIMEFRKREKL